MHEGRMVGDTSRLLHVVRDDNHSVVLAQRVQEVLYFSGRNRVQSGSRLVQPQDFRVDGERAFDA